MSLHIAAKPGEIPDFVLLPGDPLRAEWIATTRLEEVRCYNSVRGMPGFTGMYQGKRFSVQDSGMGILTISDILAWGTHSPARVRERSFGDMVTLAFHRR